MNKSGPENICLEAVEIASDKIIGVAMSLVSSAAQEITATMDLEEEIRSPLSVEYFSLLKKKAHEGITVTRLAFGTKSDFTIFMNRLEKLPANYKCIHTDSTDYRRMLLVDNSKMLFALEESNGRKYFFTEDVSSISTFTKYFLRHLSLV